MAAPGPLANRELLEFLVEHELTMAELARLLGTDRRTIMRWGNKHRLTRFQRLALLGLKVSTLSAALPLERTPSQEREAAKILQQRVKQLEAA